MYASGHSGQQRTQLSTLPNKFVNFFPAASLREIVTCSQCNTAFSRRRDLFQHVLKKHKSSAKRQTTCSYCGTNFKTSEKLTNHIINCQKTNPISNTSTACICNQQIHHRYYHVNYSLNYQHKTLHIKTCPTIKECLKTLKIRTHKLYIAKDDKSFESEKFFNFNILENDIINCINSNSLNLKKLAVALILQPAISVPYKQVFAFVE